MLTSSRELTNIPISFSLLYEKEYKNLYLFLNLKKNKDKLGKRRAFTEIKYTYYPSNLNSSSILLKD